MAVKKNMSDKNNVCRFLGTKSVEFMMDKKCRKFVKRGDIIHLDGEDYQFDGKHWMHIEGVSVQKSDKPEFSDIIQRMEFTLAEIQKWGYKVNEAIGLLRRRSSNRGDVIVLCGLIVMFFLGILVGGFRI